MSNKYRNRQIKGFDSVKEYKRWQELSIMEKAGVVQGLERQVRFDILPPQYENKKLLYRGIVYVADFTYWKDGEFIVEDVKGYKKGQAYAVYMIKKKLMYYFHHIKIMEV